MVRHGVEQGPPLRDAVDIRLPSGEVVGDPVSTPRWQETKTGDLDLGREDAEPITVDELLAEKHHRIYGRPWALGRAYADHLLSRELRSDLPLLDLGCGAGRVGIWLIPSLDPGCYCGTESHLRSLWAFAKYEIPLHGLAPRRPQLVLDNEFNVECFGVEFDTVLDLYVTWHLGEERAERAYRKIRNVMRTGGRVFLNDAPVLQRDVLRRLGFEVTDARSLTFSVFEGSSSRPTDEWHELTAV